MSVPTVSYLHDESAPWLRGKLHLAAALATVPAAAALLSASPAGPRKAAAAVYAASSLGLYAISATYHAVTHRGTSRQVFRRLDHSMIYLHIVGAATVPVVVCAPPRWRPALLGLVWSAAAAGVVLRGIVPGRAPNVARALYLAPGWSMVVVLPSIAATEPAAAAAFVAAGLIYTEAAALFATGRPRWRLGWAGSHECWHAQTVVAGALVYAANYLLVTSPS